jgi:glucosamine 6-phosphate synthetase-like amidotransferase/phosphosugar isomerase protein
MCCIFGYIHYGKELKDVNLMEIYNNLAQASIVRGPHASGIAYVDSINPLKSSLKIKKDVCDLIEADFSYPINSVNVMGHCRLSLEEDYKEIENNHPFFGKTRDEKKYALQHNGILAHLNEVRETLGLPITNITTDTYAAVQILNTMPHLNKQALKHMCKNLHGSYTFTILDEDNNFYVCRGDVPLYLVHFKKLSLYVYISTRDLFEKAIENTNLKFPYITANLESNESDVQIVPLNKGDILKISEDGTLKYDKFQFDESTAIIHNWYQHTITMCDELEEQLANLNN